MTDDAPTSLVPVTRSTVRRRRSDLWTELADVTRAFGREPDGDRHDELWRAADALLEAGVEVIDFGKGDPNEPTDPMIRQALVDALPERSPYPLAAGLPELREAAASWCVTRFGVSVDPATEIVPR